MIISKRALRARARVAKQRPCPRRASRCRLDGSISPRARMFCTRQAPVRENVPLGSTDEDIAPDGLFFKHHNKKTTTWRAMLIITTWLFFLRNTIFQCRSRVHNKSGDVCTRRTNKTMILPYSTIAPIHQVIRTRTVMSTHLDSWFVRHYMERTLSPSTFFQYTTRSYILFTCDSCSMSQAYMFRPSDFIAQVLYVHV